MVDEVNNLNTPATVDSMGRDRDNYVLDLFEPYSDEVKREAFLVMAETGWNYIESEKVLKARFPDWKAHPSYRTLKRWVARHENHLFVNVLFPEAIRHAHQVLTDPKETTHDKNEVMKTVVEQVRGKPKQQITGDVRHSHTLSYSELMGLKPKEKTPPVDGEWSESEED
jgi:hypothetical protein